MIQLFVEILTGARRQFEGSTVPDKLHDIARAIEHRAAV